MSLPQLEQSSRLVCYVSGALVGAVTNFAFSSATNRTEIRGIDLLYVQELGVSTTVVNGTINLLRPIGLGGAQGIGLVAQSSDLPFEKYVTLLILDIVTDQTLFKSDFVVVNSENWTISPKQFVTGTVQFTAINYTNEVST